MNTFAQDVRALIALSALALVLASVAQAASSAPQPSTGSRPPLRGNYPGNYTSRQDSQRQAVAPATNTSSAASRTPRRGNYPGSYTAATTNSTSPGFAWGDAGIGAAFTAGLFLLGAAANRITRQRRQPAHAL